MEADVLPILLNVSNCLFPGLLRTSSILDVLMSFCTSVRVNRGSEINCKYFNFFLTLLSG